jgi:hypothetical protein
MLLKLTYPNGTIFSKINFNKIHTRVIQKNFFWSKFTKNVGGEGVGEGSKC